MISSAFRPMEDLKDVEAAAAAVGVVSGGSGMGGSGQMGGGRNPGGGMGANGPASLQYSIPGILHFLQHEWARFEMERGQWEVEKAELQVRFLSRWDDGLFGDPVRQ